MKKNTLKQFEYNRENVIGIAEIKKILQDSAEFEEFVEENKESLQKAYGDHFKAPFKKDLQQKLETLERFQYLQNLESTLEGKIYERIKGMSSGIQENVEKLLENIDFSEISHEEWEVIRYAPEQLIKEGMFDVSKELVDKYEQIVKVEVRQQLKNIQALDSDLDTLDLTDQTVQIRLKEHFSRATSLVGIMKRYGKERTGEQSPTLEDRYMEAHLFDALMKNVREGKNVSQAIEQINDIYDALQSDLDKGQKHHDGLKKMYLDMKDSSQEKLTADFSEFVRDHKPGFSPEESNRLLSSPDIIEGDETMAELVTEALSDIKGYEFEIFLMEFTDIDAEKKTERKKKLEKEQKKTTDKILKWIDQYRYHGAKPAKNIDALPEKTASVTQRQQLRYISENFDNAETGQQLRNDVAGLTSSKETAEMIKKYQDIVKVEMMKKLGKTEQQIEKYLMNQPRANIFIAYRSFKKHQQQSEDLSQVEEQMSPTQVQSIRSEIETLESLSNTLGEDGMLPEESIDAYTAAIRRIFHHAGLPEDYFKKQGKDFFTKETPAYAGEYLSKIPPFEQAQIHYFLKNHPNNIIPQRQVLEKHFKGTVELTAENLDISDPKKVKKFFETFFQEYNSSTGTARPDSQGSSYYRKMATLMTLDHPLTAMRYMTNGDLFMHDGVPLYNHHEVISLGNKPATFKDRSADLMTKLMTAIKSNDVMHMGMLMQTIGKGLISDVDWFPVGTLKSQEKTNTMMKNVQNYRFGAFPNYKTDGDDQLKYESDLTQNHEGINELSTTLAHDKCYKETFIPQEEAQQRARESARNDEIPGGFFTNADSDSSTAGAGAGVQEGDPYHDHLKNTFESEDKILEANVHEFGHTMGRVKTYVPRALGESWEIAKYYPVGLSLNYVDEFSKNTDFIAPMSLFILVQKAWENMTKRTDDWVEMNANLLGSKIFQGTFMEPEFNKNYQDNENARVSFYKDSMGDFGHTQVLERMHNPSEMFEFKAAVEELFETRGYCNIDALLEPQVINNINKFSTLRVPTQFTRDQILGDEEISAHMYGKIEAAIDQMWGDGTFQNLRNKATGSFDSKKNEYKESAKTMTGIEKLQKLGSIWENLGSSAGKKILADMHPAEMYGIIEWEMLEGGQDSWATFGLMQALVIEGYIPANQVRKLQNEHSNDLPSYSIQEPMQAEYSGLADQYRESRGKPFCENPSKNPFLAFYDGACKLKLKGVRQDGKWGFPNTKAKYEASKNDMEEISVTVHELQKARQAQVEHFRKMDNSCIHIFSPSYEWSEIEQGLTTDTNGNMDARPHDIVASYRGVQDRFVAEMNHLDSLPDDGGEEEQLDFDRTCYYAYKMIALACGYTSYLSRSVGRKKDYHLNPDGSIDFKRPYQEDRSKGTTNYQKLILGNTGPQQRMGQSATMLDGSDALGNDLRKDFKEMTGHQFVGSLGVNHSTGKKDSETGRQTYEPMEFDPAEKFKKTIASFLRQVNVIAGKKNLSANITNRNFGLVNLNGHDRMKQMDDFRINVAKLT
ncbi:MAG: hypothetical protein P1V18_00380 [Candidatus Gracilibacteria bacterium]|nr:hypothetical protein [Candidatus Gracilibacteria bacterium]